MRYLWGGLSLAFFFGAIAVSIAMLGSGRDAALYAVIAFVVLLLSYFARRIARRYP